MLGWQASRDPSWTQGAPPPYVPPPAAGESASYVAPPGAAAALAVAARRAFGLYTDARDVTDGERALLEVASPPVTDPAVQKFLAWRRSVQLVAAIALLPLLILELADLIDSKGTPGMLIALLVLQLLVDISFTALLWTQLGGWTRWQRQRRILAAGWLAFFLVPFLLHLYPLRWAMEDPVAVMLGDAEAARATGVAFGVLASVLAMIQLAPRAMALVPGILRGAATAKLAFPGAAGPGWLMLLLAPIGALLAYVLLVIPYQVSGSGHFALAMIGLIAAQLWLARLGHELAGPRSLEEVLALVRKARATYIALNAIGVLFVSFGLASLLRQLHIPIWMCFQVLVSVLVNVLLVTLIATDQIVANLVRGQKQPATPGAAEAEAGLARDLARFDDEAEDERTPVGDAP